MTISDFGLDRKLTGQYVLIMAQTATLEIVPETRKEKKTTQIVIVGLAAMLACGAATGWALYSQGYESTDDAQVDGHLNVVSARLAGTTAAVYVTENQTVEAGQPLVDLDPSEQKVAYAQAKAQYDQAVSQLNAERPSVAITEADNTAASVTGNVQVAQANAAFAAASQDLASVSAKLVEAEAIRTRDDADLKRYRTALWRRNDFPPGLRALFGRGAFC